MSQEDEILINIPLLKTAIRVWLMETLVSGFNFFVLMNLIYEPRWSVLVAHQIGMSTRIAYIFVFAYFLLRSVKEYDTRDLIHVGILWLSLTLLFEWVGSLAIGRSVEEILIGWNIFEGYMWPYVLLTYLLSNLIIGTLFAPSKRRACHNMAYAMWVSKLVSTALCEQTRRTLHCKPP